MGGQINEMMSTAKMLFTDRYSDAIIDVDLGEKRRCPYCGKILYQGIEAKGTKIHIRCKCKKFVTIEVI